MSAPVIRLILQLSLLLTGLLSGLLAATEYAAPMDKSEWAVSSSIFACEMAQTVPFYGRARFYHRAGEPLTLELLPSTPRLETGKARLVARAPVWRPDGMDINLGLIPVTRGKRPVGLKPGLANRALTELSGGRELVFTRYPWYGASESSRVALSPVNFQAAYSQFLQCLSALLPVNYEQIARSSIYFPSSGDNFPPAENTKLRNIATYVLADPQIGHLYIDGHTDSKGLREDNLALSKRRAEAVAAFLRALGVPGDMMTVRWHGERYPIASNQSRKGRSQNRRVTVRVDKRDATTVAASQ